MKVQRLFSILIILLLAGCSHSQVWEKTGGNQRSFDLDSKECDYFAQQLALQQSETGKTIDPANYNKEFFQCIGAKGWRRKIDASEESIKEKDSGTIRYLAQLIKSNSIKGFDQTITLPDTYRLVTNKQFQIGHTLIQQFFWKGENSSFINILFQENTADHFNQIPYPLSEPYMQYTSGEGHKAKERLQWATFYGHIEPDWIMGTGAYYYAGKQERIIIVITKPLAPPDGKAPPDVTLTENQFKQMEQFSEQWQHWLNQQFQQGPGLIKQLTHWLNFGI